MGKTEPGVTAAPAAENPHGAGSSTGKAARLEENKNGAGLNRGARSPQLAVATGELATPPVPASRRAAYLAVRDAFLAADIPDAAFDAEQLVRHATGAASLAPGGVSAQQWQQLCGFSARRLRREPLQYILGSWPFLGLELAVGPGVLVPRPETEEVCLAAAALLRAMAPGVNTQSEGDTGENAPAPEMVENKETADTKGTKTKGAAAQVGAGIPPNHVQKTHAGSGHHPGGLPGAHLPPAASPRAWARQQRLSPPVGAAGKASAGKISAGKTSAGETTPPPNQEWPGAPSSMVGAGLSILDLCSGTGALALGLQSLFPAAHITAVEWDAAAFQYLTKNISAFAAGGAPAPQAVRADALTFHTALRPASLDLIVSNPPYVSAGEYAALSPEVHAEPKQALLAPQEGLAFYAALAPGYLAALKPGGALVFEIGTGQGDAVAELLRRAGYIDVTMQRDMAGHPRIVTGKKAAETK